MSMTCKLVELPENAVRVYFSGDIAADFNTNLSQDLHGKDRYFIDFGDVLRMNSIGTRGLVELVSAWAASGGQVFFERCVPDVVEQVNLLPVLSDNVTVVSVYTDESCPNGHGVIARLVHIKEDLNFTSSGLPWLKPLQCRVCGSVLESEHMPEMYFDFAVNDRSA